MKRSRTPRAMHEIVKQTEGNQEIDLEENVRRRGADPECHEVPNEVQHFILFLLVIESNEAL